MKDELRTMISKWVVEDRLTDPQVGYKIRKYYWKNIHSYEHWLNEETPPTDVLDYMYGGGDEDVVVKDKSSDEEEYDDNIYSPV